MMPTYRSTNLANAGRALAERIPNLNNRLEGLEGQPARDRMQASWDAGRNALKHQGWGRTDIETLEQYMVERGVADHGIAAASFPYKPSGKGWLLNRLEVDEKSALESGDDDGFLSLAISRALAES